MEALEQLDAYLAAQGMPQAVAAIRREHVEAFLLDLFERGRKPATVSNRFRALQQFFKFLVEEGEITDTPMGACTHRRSPSSLSPCSPSTT